MAWRWCVIINLRSGAHAHSALAHRVAKAFNLHGVEPPVEIVHGADVAAAARRALDAGASVVVAGGGDGTIGTVASVLMGTSTALGVLPLGTLNHFAKDLRIPLDLGAAVATIVAGHTAAIDVAELNGRGFINNASIGLYPRMVWERERQRRRGRRKWMAIAVAAARVSRHYRRVRVVLDEAPQPRIIHTPFVFVGNNRYEMEGMTFGGRRRLDAGVLHVTMAPGMTRGELLRGLCAALVGRLHGVENFESISTARFTIEALRRRLGVTLDGELHVVETPLIFRIRPGALRVLVPAP